MPSQQKWTQKSFKKRNESQYFIDLREPTAFIPRFAWQQASAGMIYRLTFEKVEKVFGYCIIIREHQNYVIRLEQEAEKDNDIYPPGKCRKVKCFINRAVARFIFLSYIISIQI